MNDTLMILTVAAIALLCALCLPRHWRIIDFKGFKYFRGTWKHFGLRSAITQLSPLANRIIHRNYFRGVMLWLVAAILMLGCLPIMAQSKYQAWDKPVVIGDTAPANDTLRQYYHEEEAQAIREHGPMAWPDPQTAGIGITVSNAVTGLPQALSYSNTVFKVDVGEFTSGLNGTTIAQSYVRGTYCFNEHFGLGAEGQFGANNVLNAGYAVGELRKVLSDNAEVYGAGGAGYSWVDRAVEGFIGLGSRIVPINSLNALSAQVEVDVGVSGQKNTRPGLGVHGGVGWRF